MSKQAMYITQAHLLLAGLAAGFWLFSKISLTTPESTSTEYTNSVKTEKTIVLSEKATKGKILFISKCASCHHVFKTIIGPALAGFETRGPWSDRQQLYSWIRNPEKFMKNNTYTQELKKQFGPIMTPFPAMTDEEIDAIAEYTNANSVQKPVP